MPGHGRGFGRGKGRGAGGRDGGRHTLLTTRLLEPALLVLLSQGGDQHGYTLLERVDALGLRFLQPSLVYRVLREMEDVGWVSSIWDHEQTQGPPRRVYKLTEEGLAALREWKKHLEQTQDILSKLLEQINEQS